jgi:hypothetical protein
VSEVALLLPRLVAKFEAVNGPEPERRKIQPQT